MYQKSFHLGLKRWKAENHNTTPEHKYSIWPGKKVGMEKVYADECRSDFKAKWCIIQFHLAHSF